MSMSSFLILNWKCLYLFIIDMENVFQDQHYKFIIITFVSLILLFST